MHVLISFCFSGILIYFCFFRSKSGLHQYFWQIVKLFRINFLLLVFSKFNIFLKLNLISGDIFFKVIGFFSPLSAEVEGNYSFRFRPSH